MKPGSTTEHYVLRDWGSVTRLEARDWTTRLQQGLGPRNGNPGFPDVPQVCHYDVANLRLALKALRKCIGSKLFAQVEAEAQDSTMGPEYWIIIMSKVTGSSPQAIRNMTNVLAEMKLSDEPGEDVGKFAVKISAKCTLLMGTSTPPPDLAYIAARTFTYCTDERFRSLANDITNKLLRKHDPTKWTDVITEFVAEYDQRIPQGDWAGAQQTSTKEKAVSYTHLTLPTIA